jgi:hypothetical protein
MAMSEEGTGLLTGQLVQEIERESASLTGLRNRWYIGICQEEGVGCVRFSLVLTRKQIKPISVYLCCRSSVIGWLV